MAEQYQMLEELGSGSFGTVYRALHKPTGDYVAVKHIDLEGSDDDIQEIQQEISLLATCSSEYVTRYRSSFVRGTKLWIVMEYLGGGSCLDLLKPCPKGMDERYIAIIMRELLFGLDYLHNTGKIHRDIKAANILLSETGSVKIADFGVAAQLTNIKSQRLTFVGTPFWMAPEVIQEAGYDFRADIWSLGITAMELALGEPPRSDVHPMKVLFIIPKEKPPRLEGSRFSKDFKDFVSLCLNKEAEGRPSARSLLKHPFIKRAGRTEMLQDLLVKVKELERLGLDMEKDVKYYEETLRSMGHDADDDDEWVFDTLKPTASMKAIHAPKHTMKRRKLERIPSGDASDIENAASALEHMSLDAAPLGDVSLLPTSLHTPTKELSTIRTPKTRAASGTHRRVSATARQISVSSPTARRVSRNVSGNTPTARRVSSQQRLQPQPLQEQQHQPRQPLGLDMSFGNSPSTVRQFKRVNSGHSPPSPQDSVFDSDAENRPPTAPQSGPLHASAPVVATKEAILGRRCYAKCLDASFTEALAACGDRSKREALSAVAETWARLDELDPDGEFLLLKSILERVQSDPKLASALLPQRVANAQLASLRSASPQKPHPSVTTSSSNPPSSPTKSPSRLISHAPASHHRSRASDIGPLLHPSTPTQSPSKRASTNALAHPSPSPSPSPTKLVLNPQNPHLRRMRSSQNMLAEQREKEKAAALLLDDKMPGKTPDPGLEHVGMLADVLYGRWTDGLRSRWPLA